MKTFKRSLAILLSFVLMAAVASVGFAASTTATLDFDASSNTFTYGGGLSTATNEGGDNVAYPDLFTGLKDIVPGDTLSQTIEVSASNVGSKTVKIYLQSDNENDDYDTLLYGEDGNLADITFTVKSDDDDLLDNDRTTGFDNLPDGILLATFTADGTQTITVDMAVPLTVGNEVAALEGMVDWTFTVEVTTPTTTTTESPETGDVTSLLLWLFVLAVCGAGIVFCVCYQLKRGKATKADE